MQKKGHVRRESRGAGEQGAEEIIQCLLSLLLPCSSASNSEQWTALERQ